MKQPTNRPEPERKKFSPAFLLVIILIVAIMGATIYYLTNRRQGNLDSQLSSLQNELSEFKNSPALLSTISDSAKQKDALMEAKFKLALLDLWKINQVFRDPIYKNKFYYVTNFQDASNIWMYNAEKDKSYQDTGEFDILAGNTLLYGKKMEEGLEYRGVGVINNKFIFAETGIDNSPGPCFSEWQYQNLKALDLGSASPTPQPFTVPSDLKDSEDKKVADCEKNFFGEEATSSDTENATSNPDSASKSTTSKTSPLPTSSSTKKK